MCDFCENECYITTDDGVALCLGCASTVLTRKDFLKPSWDGCTCCGGGEDSFFGSGVCSICYTYEILPLFEELGI